MNCYVRRNHVGISGQKKPIRPELNRRKAAYWGGEGGLMRTTEKSLL